MEDYKLNSEYVKGLVSIIIPTHNRCKIINETIDSLLAQTYKQIEIIIVDDNSSDNTADVVNNYARRYSFIYYYKSLKTGACAARNQGLIVCRGEFIQFMDDDDWVDENYIKYRVDILKNDLNIGFCTCNMHYYYQKNGTITKSLRIDNQEHNIETHLITSTLPTPLFLFRRISLQKIGFWDESCLRLQDICYYQRLFLHDIKGIWLPNFLYFVRLHENSISTCCNNLVIESVVKSLSMIEYEWETNKKLSKKLSRILFYLKYCILKYNNKNSFFYLKNIFLLFRWNKEAFLFYIKYRLFFKKKYCLTEYYLK